LGAATRLIRIIAVLCALAALTISSGAFAQTLAPAPDEESSITRAPPSSALQTGASAWNAPEPWRTDRFYLETSVYTKHFHYDPAHNNRQNLILGEWNITEEWLAGAAFFKNSFGQPSQYVYGGYRLRPFENLQPLYIKLSAGLVHGYTGEYQGKIPFNRVGTAPVVVPSVGYCLNRFCAEFVVFGAAGTLVTVGVTLP
jgi:hypothetical protein